MPTYTIVALRAVIGIAVVGGLFVQTVIMVMVWADLAGVPFPARVAVIVICGLWIVCLQVAALCVWRLLSLVVAGSVFSAGAFRYVDVIIGAVLGAAALTAVFATMLVPGPVAPGVVGLIYGAALVTGGVALVIVVMRALLRQATAMRAELAEVV